MKNGCPAAICLSLLAWTACAILPGVGGAGERRLNNLVSVLAEADALAGAQQSLRFSRETAGWILVAAACRGGAKIVLDDAAADHALLCAAAGESRPREAVRFVTAGEHTLRIAGGKDAVVEELSVKAIPELIHCGLGFNSAIKGYGTYDMEFLAPDILPNITTTIVPGNIQLSAEAIDEWHRQGKRFVAEIGISAQAATAEEHAQHWTAAFEKAPFLDGVIVNEFIVNNSSARPTARLATNAANATSGSRKSIAFTSRRSSSCAPMSAIATR